ncbi:hypothetical protein AMEX_G21219, partial [Astyanax mexicanus]
YIHKDSQSVFLLDPMAKNELTRSEEAAKCFRNFLDVRKHKDKKWAEVEWKPQTIDHTVQKDTHSCGVFVMEMAKQLINFYPRLPSHIVVDERVDQLRRTMASEIISASEDLVNACQWCAAYTSRKKDVFWICCSTCDRWNHITCVAMSKDEFNEYEGKDRNYYCPACAESSKLPINEDR